MKTQRQNNWSV